MEFPRKSGIERTSGWNNLPVSESIFLLERSDNMTSDYRINYEKTPFLQSSQTGSSLDRLNFRCDVLLSSNQEAIKGKRILDLASHDGRFSHACLELGARHVTGVEGRHHLVESANKNLIDMGHNPKFFSFVQDDIFDYLHKVTPKEFDTVLCFGFFYHTIRQSELISEIRRIQPAHFLLDTLISKDTDEKPCLVFMPESHEIEGSTIDPIDLVAWPTKNYIELILRTYGFSFKELQWSSEKVNNLKEIGDYTQSVRVSYYSKRN
ncbi:MAG: class I SAM-dependent methyltransferase [Deltaproteobacteria bacterium]|nr:class I SAM-dependent methyltransferase [Deltaproteobacteria bacterium]